MSLMGHATGLDAKGSRRLLIVVGEVKEIAPSRYGHKIIFKHLPDCHFMLSAELHTRLMRRFEIDAQPVGRS